MKGRVFFIAAVLFLVALVPGVYWVLFQRGFSVSSSHSPEPMAPSDLKAELLVEVPEQLPVVLSVTQLSGQVKIARPDEQGWQEAEEGMVLGARDRIRTELKSHATLSMPGVFSVELSPESDFKVRALAEDAYRFLLEEGMISAEVQDDPDHVFEMAGSTSLASTRGGKFNMNVDRAGLVALGAERGKVHLESAGKVVVVEEGFQARVMPGQVPDDPIRIPKKLFLKVRWPKGKILSKRQVLVSGRTEPGARVSLDGLIVAVDSEGKFKKVVALGEGNNQVEVVSQGVGGTRSREKSGKMRVDTRGDRFQIETSPEMWKKNGGDPDG